MNMGAMVLFLLLGARTSSDIPTVATVEVAEEMEGQQGNIAAPMAGESNVVS